MLDDGVPYSAIAREVAVPLSTLGRYALLRKSELAKLADDEPGITAVLTRMVEVADHAQQIRRQTKIAGSAVAQSRAIKSELEVLGKLLTELGITETSIAEYGEQISALVSVIKKFVREHPDSASDFIAVMAQTPETAELARALRAQNGMDK